ncbi:MAG TPA: hypothetical protein PLL78_05515 [Fimbriimonadaceae bacterium]|nr:hypothetical protein [Fimbriimonadaceae bacterium]HRJ96125.1 hypothetical protein [Fimbriimonadaceae bacterium]
MRPILALLALPVLAYGLSRQQHTPPDRPAPVKRTGDPTFSADIAPMFRQKCLSCHVESGHAPFPLVTYTDVMKRASLVRTIAMIRSMPPTHMHSDFGTIALQEALTDEEVVTIQEWVRLGTPEGPKIELPPPAPVWSLGEPDLVLKLPKPKPVKAEGLAYWRAYTLPSGAALGRRIRAVDVRPLAPKAVRHVLVAQDAVGQLARRDRSGAGIDTYGSLRPYLGDPTNLNILATWAPGYPPWFPRMASAEVTAKDLAVQVLYQPTGKPEDAGIEIALYFTTEPPSKARWVSRTRTDFLIPPEGTPTLTETVEIEEDSLLFGLYPEARLFCSQIVVDLILPEGGRKIALGIYKWNPIWIGSYLFPTPIGLPKGSRLRAEFTYDNGKHSGRNEGRTPVPVKFGNGADREMMGIAYLIGTVG